MNFLVDATTNSDSTNLLIEMQINWPLINLFMVQFQFIVIESRDHYSSVCIFIIL